MPNTTQLNPDTTFERHVYHRDQFAHYLRWTHVMKRLKRDQTVLDWGCGSGNLLEVIYRNKLRSFRYLGLEYRPKTVQQCNDKYAMLDWAEFKQQDLTKDDFYYGNNWDILCSFEVIEHIGRSNAERFLCNINNHCNKETVVLLSTPCYDPAVGAADNHIVNGVINEFTYSEMKDLIEGAGFKIVNQWGTFASIKDYEPYMNEWQRKYYKIAKEYFDSNILSNLMAPMFPEYSRNTMWECRI